MIPIKKSIVGLKRMLTNLQNKLLFNGQSERSQRDITDIQNMMEQFEVTIYIYIYIYFEMLFIKCMQYVDWTSSA